jgi:regulator of sirC expression with transglutaminase-like and TPR domain
VWKAIAHQVQPIDSPFFAVARRCMAPDPAQRYTDFPALREAIKSALKAVKIPAMDFIVASGFRGSFDDYVKRGRSYLVLGRHARALKILDRAVKHDPTSYPALVARAEALAQRGHYVEAVRAYESVSALKPEDAAPIIGMAFSWLALDTPQKARAALDRILGSRPDNVEALLLLARVCGAEGDNQDALRIIEKVIAFDPREWRAHEFRGRALRGVRKVHGSRASSGADPPGSGTRWREERRTRRFRPLSRMATRCGSKPPARGPTRLPAMAAIITGGMLAIIVDMSMIAVAGSASPTTSSSTRFRAHHSDAGVIIALPAASITGSMPPIMMMLTCRYRPWPADAGADRQGAGQYPEPKGGLRTVAGRVMDG